LVALASVDADQRLEELAERLEQPITWKKKRVRGLHPFSGPDSILFQLISRGEWALCGFRNADLQRLRFSQPAESPEEKRRRSAWVSRRLRLLRAHRLIKKVPRQNRYHLTEFGRTATTAILAARQATVSHLNSKAA
jgi:DNA-binding HxlR family transcriptional regulator